MASDTRGAAPPADPPTPDWASAARETATQKLQTLPTLAGREDWRFTRPRDLALEGPEPEAVIDAAGGAAVPELPADGRSGVLVLADGQVVQAAFAPPEGVVVAELGAALAEHGELVRDHLYGLIGFDDTPGALNAARWDAGLFVYVPRGAELVAPAEALLWATGAAGRVFGRTLVVVEEGAKATIVDRYGSPDLPGPVQASSVVEIHAGTGAEVEHVSFVQWGEGVRHHAQLRAHAGRDARVRSVVVTLGGDVVRVEPTMVCAGPGADARALGLYFAAGRQHFEHRVVARHEAPNTYSNLLYKGALKDTAHTVFYGNLIVPPGAPGTDAYQTNRNLVLNPGARADTIPFLEIETAEVKCSHAGAVGRVDDEHLFYLRSRGVPEAVAKRLIVLGYLQEVLAQVSLPDVRTELERAVEEKLA